MSQSVHSIMLWSDVVCYALVSSVFRGRSLAITGPSRHLPVLQRNALDCTAFNWNTSFCGVDTVLWPLFCVACFLFSKFSRRPVCCLLCSVSSVSYLVSPLHCCVHCLVFVLSVLLGLIVLPAHSRERWLARCPPPPPHSQCSKSSFSVFLVFSFSLSLSLSFWQ